jgi:excisionase family DNA binding protein
MLVVDAVEMVDVREAAVIAGRDPETIRRWIRAGRLTAQRQGNRLIVPRSQVERLAGSTGPTHALSLAEWAEIVAQHRDTEAATSRTPADVASTTAADLVLGDRATH